MCPQCILPELGNSHLMVPGFPGGNRSVKDEMYRGLCYRFGQYVFQIHGLFSRFGGGSFRGDAHAAGISQQSPGTCSD